MPRLRTLLLVAGDLFVLFLAFISAAWCISTWGGVWDIDFWFLFEEENLLRKILLISISVILGLYFLDLYEKVRVSSRRRLFEDLILVFGVMFLLQAFIAYTYLPFTISRYLMLLGSLLAILLLVGWRMIYSSLLLNSMGQQKIVMIGDTALTRQVWEFVAQHPERGYRVVAVYGNEGVEQSPTGRIEKLGEAMLEPLLAHEPDLITVAHDHQASPELANDLLQCSMRGIAVVSLGDVYEELFHRVSLQAISTNQLIFSPAFRPKPLVEVAQAIYGRLLALLGLAVSWPVMIVTGIAVRLDSPGPAILRQVRLGQGGVPFAFLKFRSMYVDADARSGPVRAQENDPRITRVGRWIRLTRIDELPQLINVLRGEMTLVGPRPEMPELEKRLLKDLPLYTQRHRIKPGITGWAQIHHEPEDSISSTARKLEYDLYYIKNMTPAMDFITLFHTIKAVILRIGAR